MISTHEALTILLQLTRQNNKEKIYIEKSADRILSDDLIAKYNQPPLPTSAMDGYAIKKHDKVSGSKLSVIGECAAGNNFEGSVKDGEAVRIFTGAPLPIGTDCIVIQENVVVIKDQIIIKQNFEHNNFVRGTGFDFRKGFTIKAPIKINPAVVSLVAAMNYNKVSVFKKPKVAIIVTGNELVEPGNKIPANKIVSSNSYGLLAMLKSFGAKAKMFPITEDNPFTIQKRIKKAKNFDLILTVGGVSVGDYDLVEDAASKLGFKLAFHSVAMKPGKPLLAGTINDKILIGLPGNPVSALISCYVMVKPVIEKMLGFGTNNTELTIYAKLGSKLKKNGKREHFQRAVLKNENNEFVVYPLQRQDSSLLSELRKSNSLIKRLPYAPALTTGQKVKVLTFYSEFY